MTSLEERIRRAIEATDTDDLLRIVDGHVAAAEWDALAALRRRCREAVQRGKQLWSIDEHIRYRFALDGPAASAGAAVAEGDARFALGPLPEVAAQRHSWAELEPHLPDGPARALVAHERVLRGEDLTGARFDPHVLELPPALQPWEPGYPLAEYRSDRAEFPSPDPPRLEPAPPAGPGTPVDDPEAVEALLGLVAPWLTESNGRAEVAVVEGEASTAVAALGARQVLMSALEPAAALAWMGWGAASGGAHGRRRGAAAGRFGAWWAAAAVAGLDWPPDPDLLGREVGRLGWYLWSDGAGTGWVLQLAVEDRAEGLAWALTAADAAATSSPFSSASSLFSRAEHER